MTIINYINASLEIWGCVILGIVAICLTLSKQALGKSEHLYFWMLASNACVLLFDTLALFFRGHPGNLCWWGVRASNFIAFSASYLLLETFVHYLTVFLGKSTKVSRLPLIIVRVICAASLLLVVLTQFFPIIYTIDAHNVYHRAGLFWLSQLAGIVGMLFSAAMLLLYRKTIELQEKVALWAYIALPIIAMVIQIFVYGIALLNLANTIAIVVIFLFLQAEQGRRAAEQKTC